MKAGRLGTRVQFQARVETQNEVGEPITTWVPIRTVWADIRPTRVRELMKADSVQGAGSYTVWTRYFPDVTTADRLALAPGRYLTINGPGKDLDNKHFILEFMCTEGLYEGEPS